MAYMIRVVVADDHDIVRDGLRELINNQPDMTMVGTASNGAAILETVRAQKPDVAVLDIAMPGMDGLAVLDLVKEISPETRVVIFSMHKKEAYVQQALSSGAQAYVLKSSSTSQVFEAIRSVYHGHYYLSPNIQADVISNYIENNLQQEMSCDGYDSLSEREQGIFRLMVEGRSTREMADLLCLSPKTIEKHRSSVMKKLGFKNLVSMVKYAVKIGILDPDLWVEF